MVNKKLTTHLFLPEFVQKRKPVQKRRKNSILILNAKRNYEKYRKYES